MGKDSLIKSTTKKAGTKKEKKPSKKKNASKAAGAQIEKEAPAKPKAAKKAEPVWTLQDLLFKQFTRHQPPEDSLPPALDLSGMTAPPLITSTDPQEVERLRALLERRFSMEAISAAAQEPIEIAPPVAEPAPRPPVSMEELLFKRFSPPQRLDDTPPPAPDLSQMTAPPLITSTDPQEVARLQALLDRRFTMEEINAAAQEPVVIAPPVAETAPQPQAVEPVKAPEPLVEGPPAELAVTAMPEAQAPAVSAPPVVAPTPAPAPAPEPAAPKLQEKKEPPQAAPAPAAPKAVSITPPPEAESKPQAPPSTPEPKPADSGWRSFKFGIAAVLSVFLLIMWGSFSNSGKYFVMPKKGAIEIWRGKFSPTGKQFIAVLHGVEPAAAVKASYSRKEIFPILCSYYIGKADALLDVSGLPDYKSISDFLQRAQEYAISEELRTAVQTRMDNIQRLSLMYKAEIDISKGTVPSLQLAVQTLKEVQRLTTEPSQLEALNQKIAAVNASLSALEAKTAGDADAPQKQAEQGAPSEASHAAPEK
ncbi:MAG: hypothetical protein HZB87_12405 [Desulfatitalea sp.]|nr:hypothetical protein [Desulfatitalea sp.]MBI5897446.1 hypothetical protein [Desulfobacterales bacterium]